MPTAGRLLPKAVISGAHSSVTSVSSGRPGIASTFELTQTSSTALGLVSVHEPDRERVDRLGVDAFRQQGLSFHL